MAAPISTALPAAPSRSDSPDVFEEKAFAFVGALEPFRVDLQAQADFVNAEIGNLEWVDEDTFLKFGDKTGGIDYASFGYGSATNSLNIDMFGANDTFIISDNGSVKFTFTASTGSLLATGNLSAYSDKRLKTNIRPILDSLTKCELLTGYHFDRTDLGIKQDGVLAQDVLKAIPDSVDVDKDGILSVSHSGIVALLVNCVNELHDRIKTLEKDNDTTS